MVERFPKGYRYLADLRGSLGVTVKADMPSLRGSEVKRCMSKELRDSPMARIAKMPNIRRARRTDASPLAGLAERTFRDTFSAMNTPEDMNLHCQIAYGRAIQGAEIASPHMVTLLYEQDTRLLGFAQLRWASTPKCVVAEAPGEIQRLYVVSDAKGTGVAHELMTACIDEIVSRGSDMIWLGVWERNARAIAFYKKFHFREVGEHVFPLGADPQRDVVMVRPVSSSVELECSSGAKAI